MSRTREPEARRRRQIIEAAFDVAGGTGLPAITMRAVAERANVSHALVMFHFGSKAGLLRAMLDWLVERVFLPIPIETSNHPNALERAIRQELETIDRQRGRIELFLDFWAMGRQDPALREPVQEALGRFRASLVPLIEAASDNGAGTLPADRLATAITDMLIGFAIQRSIEPELIDSDTMATALVELGKLLDR
jgi:AcrR family transcriptional regulator